MIVDDIVMELQSASADADKKTSEIYVNAIKVIQCYYNEKLSGNLEDKGNYYAVRQCTSCGSSLMVKHHNRESADGQIIRRKKCAQCGKTYYTIEADIEKSIIMQQENLKEQINELKKAVHTAAELTDSIQETIETINKL